MISTLGTLAYLWQARRGRLPTILSPNLAAEIIPEMLCEVATLEGATTEVQTWLTVFVASPV